MAITSRGAILQTIPTRFRSSVFEYLMLPREFLRIEGAVQTNDHIFRTKSREYPNRYEMALNDSVLIHRT